MKLQLLLEEDPKLNRECTPVTSITKNTLKLAFYMHKYMKDWNGIGLSAPQVDRPIQLFVVGTKDNPRLTVINPRLLSYSECASKIEGCLSFPEKFKYRYRPKVITLQYTNEKNETLTREFTGLTAQVIIHEMFHLKGITLFNKDIDNLDILLYTDNNSG